MAAHASASQTAEKRIYMVEVQLYSFAAGRRETPGRQPLRPRAPYATILVNKVRFASMTVGLAVGVTAAVVVACSAAAYVSSKHHFRALLEDARASALSQGELI